MRVRLWHLAGSLEVVHDAALGVQFDRCLPGINGGWWGQPVPAVIIASDFPSGVVVEHVVVFAQEDPVGDVAFTVVPPPVFNVVGFRPGRWPITARMHAPAPFEGKDLFLFEGEQSLVAPEV
jgi:hypothetical protein